jgi:hypothetical protein
VGSEGKYALHPVVPREDRYLPFRYDSLNPDKVEEEHKIKEAKLGVSDEGTD